MLSHQTIDDYITQIEYLKAAHNTSIEIYVNRKSILLERLKKIDPTLELKPFSDTILNDLDQAIEGLEKKGHAMETIRALLNHCKSLDKDIENTSLKLEKLQKKTKDLLKTHIEFCEYKVHRINTQILEDIELKPFFQVTTPPHHQSLGFAIDKCRKNPKLFKKFNTLWNEKKKFSNDLKKYNDQLKKLDSIVPEPIQKEKSNLYIQSEIEKNIASNKLIIELCQINIANKVAPLEQWQPKQMTATLQLSEAHYAQENIQKEIKRNQKSIDYWNKYIEEKQINMMSDPSFEKYFFIGDKGAILLNPEGRAHFKQQLEEIKMAQNRTKLFKKSNSIGHLLVPKKNTVRSVPHLEAILELYNHFIIASTVPPTIFEYKAQVLTELIAAYRKMASTPNNLSKLDVHQKALANLEKERHYWKSNYGLPSKKDVFDVTYLEKFGFSSHSSNKIDPKWTEKKPTWIIEEVPSKAKPPHSEHKKTPIASFKKR